MGYFINAVNFFNDYQKCNETHFCFKILIEIGNFRLEAADYIELGRCFTFEQRAFELKEEEELQKVTTFPPM